MEVLKEKHLNLSFLTHTNDFYLHKRKFCCRNCGKHGHLIKHCHEPITSVGIVSFKIDMDDESDEDKLFIHELEKKIIKSLSLSVSNNIPDISPNMERNKNGIIKSFEHNLQKSENGDFKTFKRKISNRSIIYDNNNSIVLFNYYKDKIKFLMVSRRYSLGYTEFIRGNYDPKKSSTLICLFEQMSPHEYGLIRNNHIKILMTEFIENNIDKNKKIADFKEFTTSIDKYEKLCLNDVFNLIFFLENIKPKWKTAEWGFPKGRRNFIEKNIECARREFFEETGYKSDKCSILSNIKPVSETFLGTNNIKYKHIYYIGLVSESDNIPENNSGEIGMVGWYSFDEIMQMIRPYHLERKKLVNQIYIFILNFIINELS